MVALFFIYFWNLISHSLWTVGVESWRPGRTWIRLQSHGDRVFLHRFTRRRASHRLEPGGHELPFLTYFSQDVTRYDNSTRAGTSAESSDAVMEATANLHLVPAYFIPPPPSRSSSTLVGNSCPPPFKRLRACRVVTCSRTTGGEQKPCRARASTDIFATDIARTVDYPPTQETDYEAAPTSKLTKRFVVQAICRRVTVTAH